ncbi:MAG TPA: LLM class flavin-dependent oxidoreductase [Dehalococcoidia bacterium]|nr:LLM class flavin-dependent oxidoreductase [Dehalococcoidia bacterium]
MTRFGITWVVNNLRSYAGLARASEEAGFELIGAPDTQAADYRELYVSLTVAALSTEQARLAPLVTNPLTRHPGVTAAALGSLHEVSDGRVIFGIGTGDTGAASLGLPYGRLGELSEYVAAVQRLLTGAPADYQGRVAQVRWLAGGIPTFIAADGPRTLEYAAGVADGLIVGSGVTPEVVAAVRERVTAGALSAGRSIDRLELWWVVRVALGADRDEALTAALPSLAAGANHALRGNLEGRALPAHLTEPIRALQAGYQVGEHSRFGATNPNARLARDLGLADYLADRFGIVGTPAECARRIRELAGFGVTNLLIRPQAADRSEFLRRWREEVRPALAG